MTVALVSGGFDPVHDGHIELLFTAAQYGRVHVALNSDDWLIRKKGYFFMPWETRRRVLAAIRWVESVIPADDGDGTVTRVLAALRPSHFVNGGDRMTADPMEDAICRRLGIIQVFGGDKINSSSALVSQFRRAEQLS